MIFNASRRGFLSMGAQALAVGAFSSLGTLQRALAAADTTGYKALVCVFLNGGNDGYNWLLPRSGSAYTTYAASRRNLALAQGGLLAINPSVSDGTQYGLHPACPEIRDLFESGKAAFVVNAGPLVVPTTPTQYRKLAVPLPYQLFSHSDQAAIWQTSVAGSTERVGWAGRIADLLHAGGLNPRLAVNVSLAGNNVFQAGRDTVFYNLGTDGAQEMKLYTDNSYFNGARRQLYLDLLAEAGNDSSLLEREYAATLTRSNQSADTVNAALASVPALTTAFNDANPLAVQLRMVARMVRARDALGLNRQIFFANMSGWDFHDTQLVDHATRLATLSSALKSFQDTLAEIGAESLVTTFTMSDFGRTLTSNGDGSDHGWGSHALVLGGAVAGKRLYGAYPDLAIDGADDAGQGRILPTTSTDQYAATLAGWFGVSGSDLDLVFPNLANFTTRNLGFV